MTEKNDSGFISNDIEDADHLAMSGWEQMLPGDALKYFEHGLPEGGLILKVTEGGKSTRYILEHGDSRFPDGKAVDWNK